MLRPLLLALALMPALWGHYTYWAPHIEADGRIGGFRNGGGGIAWIPLKHREGEVAFGQIAGGYYLDQYVATFGAGYRKLCSPCLGWGVNGFADFSRSTRFHRAYAQGGIGAELFGNCWDIRANGYFPTNNRKLLSEQLTQIPFEQEGQLCIEDIFRSIVAKAFYGGDIEAGCRYCVCGGEVRGYVGYYAYSATDIKVVQGPRVRGEYRKDGLFFPQLSVRIGGEWQTDRLHSNDLSLLIGATWDFGRCRCQCCSTSACAYLGERVYRQPAPWVLKALEKTTHIEFEDIFIFYVTADGTGTGLTQMDPTNIDEVQNFAGPGAIIILLNDAGPITVSTLMGETLVAPFSLKLNQQLGGFLNNPSIDVTLPNGLTVTIHNLNMSGPAVLTGSADLVQANSGTQLYNWETMGGQNAILLPNLTGVAISNLTLNTPNMVGIAMMGGSDLAIANLTVDTPGSDGIALTAGASAIAMSQVTVDSPGVNGVSMDMGSSLAIDTLTVSAPGSSGLVLTNGVSAIAIEGMTVTDPSASGIAMTGGGNLAIIDLLVTNPGVAGLQLNGVTGAAVVSATIQNADRAIEVQNSPGGSMSFTGLSLLNSTTYGIYLANNAGAFSFSATTLTSNTAGDALKISNQTGAIAFAGSSSTQTAGGRVLVVNGGSGALGFTGFSFTNVGASSAPIDIQNTTGGAIGMSNGSLTGVTAATGVNLAGNVAALTFDTVSVAGSNATASVFTPASPVNSGAISYRNSTFSNSSGSGILFSSIGAGTVTLTGNTFPSVAGQAISLSNSQATTTTVAVTNNIESGSPASPGSTYLFQQTAAGAVMNISVSGNLGARTGVGTGIVFTNNATMNITGGTTLSNVQALNPGMGTAPTSLGGNPVPP
ncbi:MAG: right-handed parallel beta-helix repeat-containing protein [Parachlamydiales bacterium]